MNPGDFRGGSKVDLNVYGEPTKQWPHGRPICQCHTPHDAARIIYAVNFHNRAGQYAGQWEHFAESEKDELPRTIRVKSDDYIAGFREALRLCSGQLTIADRESDPQYGPPPLSTTRREQPRGTNWDIRPLLPQPGFGDAGTSRHPHDDWGNG